MSHSIKRGLLIGFLWSFGGRLGYLLVSMITNILLARLLGPGAFGQIGIVMFFIVIAKVLSESGLSGAMIRKQEVNDEDYSTVFIFNFVVSIFLFLLYILCAKLISLYYDDSELTNLLIVSSLVLIINAFQITQNVRLIRALDYKKKSKLEFISVSIASGISLILAYYFNFGVWSVVVMQLMTSLLITVLFWCFCEKVKTLRFSIKSFKELYKFGLNTTLALLLNTIFDNIYQLVLGKYFEVRQTGLYYQARKLQEMPVGIIKSTALGVVFASLSKIQDDTERFTVAYNKIITMFTIAVGFVCFFIYFYSKSIILILYGQEWIEAVFYIQILIIASFFFMQEMFNRIIFKVFDKTKQILVLEIFKKLVQTITIIVGVIYRDINLLIFGILIVSIVSYFINYYYSRKIFGGFSWYEVSIVLKVILVSFCTVLIGHIFKLFFGSSDLVLISIFPVLFLLYILLIKLFNVSDVINDLKMVKTILINND